MITLANFVFVLTSILILVQMFLVFRYAIRMDCRKPGESDRSYQPPVTVVLCLRGCDPSLRECLSALLDQDYKEYRLLCVLDSQRDPATKIIAEFKQDPRLQQLISPATDNVCSLKCNSLVTAFEQLEDRIAVLVDADTVPDKHWLSDLVAPLSEKDVVAASGNRWFVPVDRRIGSYVRYLWNMAAAPQMDAFKITWGGSLALKVGFVKTSGLLDAWRKSLFEDASVAGFAQRSGKRVQMLPQLLLPNREGISRVDATHWIKRQLLDTRLYHSAFSKVVVHCYSVVALIIVAVGVFLYASIVKGDGLKSGMVLTMCLVNYVVFYIGVWFVLDKSARDVLKNRGHELPKHRWLNPKALFSVIATQWAYTVATRQAMKARQVTWRGIEYQVNGPYSIQMAEYHEMKSSDPDGESANESL